MPKPCVTISLVEQAKGGPFVFHDDLEAGCAAAAEIGFPAVELFLPGPDVVSPDTLRSVLDKYSLDLAAVGTGAGWVIHQKSLTAADEESRAAAKDFVRSMIDYGGPFGAPAIIGSMQGRSGGDVDAATARSYLKEALDELGEYASKYDLPLIYEPLNRYETNLINTVDEGVKLLSELTTDNVTLLADLFHMNIEEANVAAALKAGADKVGHIHYVDSNRQAAGFGHTNFAPIVTALKEINYDGYLCAEAFPIPDSMQTAQQTFKAISEHFPS